MRALFFSVALLWVPLCLAQPADQQERAELRDFLDATINSAESFDDKYDAEVWLVDMSARLARYVKDPAYRLEILRQIHAASLKADLPPELVLSVIEVESHFDRFAVSRVGAQGMMQVMPFWKDEIGRPDDNLTYNLTNFSYGCRILQFYLQREDGDLHKALARYNGSVGRRTYSNKVYRAWDKHWRNGPLDWAD
ncbi:lytic transglycosylase domain-containing protein [Halioglobus maricola]|uniref:Lytic transglycosylase domain-containing protein n=1 Tax=Halioglobus maricola TaxID=2601894 RepID=A0A5P9NGS4_9GAMM|nr:lytic transglycosylase domain-containing protein [Halioglobus maricola]